MCVSLFKSVFCFDCSYFLPFLHCVLVYLFIFLFSCHVCYLFCVYFVYDSHTNNNVRRTQHPGCLLGNDPKTSRAVRFEARKIV